ncbi:pepsin/retropepsin-like aspartic protease family protein [Hymenobacter ruricola]|uniref:Aspartyl protease family protein n=1 Tax=Hymenobacter ruricola TaxID=2791023 RepID=A0ABS0I353_9BACT|nr:pepsin/retropepsin-like aspartic protease family protein [Hymenobacter ruricola]MBF9221344.1 aspartyl protease family protein [Hymenobacter ruricola]
MYFPTDKHQHLMKQVSQDYTARFVALAVLFAVLLLNGGQLAAAQHPAPTPRGARSGMPFIRATSAQIKILDGNYLQDGGLAPGLKPDTYVYRKSAKPKRIVYYTDLDSLSFLVTKDTYDFAIILNGRDTCYQRITAQNPAQVQYVRPVGRSPVASDTIPFVLGTNNAIHLQGKLNGSAPLDLVFDTGANMGVLSEEGAKKGARLAGDHENVFELSGIQLKNSPAIFVDYHGGTKADGVLGYNAFEDKIVEINYDRHVLVISSTARPETNGYAALPMQWRGQNLFVEGSLLVRGKPHPGLFLFDTGSKWALSLTKAYCAKEQLYGQMTELGTREGRGVNGKTIESRTVRLPALQLGELTLPNVPIDLEQPGEGQGLAFSLLGNDVLKRFNVVLDYQNDVIYLRPNSLLRASYNRSFNKRLLLLASGTVLALVAGGIFRKRLIGR